MRCITLIICLLCSICGLRAENLTFSTPIWDFGAIEELGGDVSHTFEFKNNSSTPIVIVNVRTTCGCTTPIFTRKPVAAGESSTITITFDPRFRPGVFRKDISIYTSASSDPVLIQIAGRVTPRKLSVEERYPYALTTGGRLGAMYITVSELTADELRETSVEYYNESKRDFKIEFRPRRKSESLRLFYDEVVKAGEGASVGVGYFFEGRGVEDRPVRDTVDIYINGKNTGKSLFIKGVWAR